MLKALYEIKGGPLCIPIFPQQLNEKVNYSKLVTLFFFDSLLFEIIVRRCGIQYILKLLLSDLFSNLLRITVGHVDMRNLKKQVLTHLDTAAVGNCRILVPPWTNFYESWNSLFFASDT